ncbi:MAG: hypothetical protein MUC36_17510 [Planctomycetes bacterium]|jgi:hypothetical protein|nr:hypothetical protein [Planctomycetota bacterium]
MRHRALAVLSGFLLAAVATAQAPPGYKTWENKLQRVTFYYPVVFQELPLPPTEQVLVAKYVLKDQPEELKKIDVRMWRQMTPSLEVFCYAATAPVTGGADAAEPEKGPDTLREAMEEQNRVHSWDDFVKRFEQWSLFEDSKKPGHYELAWKGEWRYPVAKPVGYLIKKQDGGSVYGVYGYSYDLGQKTLQTWVGKVAAGMKLAAENLGDKAEAAIDKLYASGKFRDVEGRKKARSAMASGWKALDTENYLIVHHSKNEALIKRIGRDIEAMRLLYIELFPPKGPVDKLSVVRVCRTKDEYHQYGGPPNSGGFWHPGNEELVFYDYSYTMKTLDDDVRKRYDKAKVKLTDDDSLLVLYHEAFHQYIHYAIGEFSPHDWFNEGYGDFFSGAVVGDSSGKVMRIEPSPWRIHVVKDMCEFGIGFIPLKEILEAERAVFYNPARAGHFYAGAWSFVYFLKNSKEAAAHPQWSKLLQLYFDGVKAAYDRELAKLGPEPDLGQRQVAGFAARKAALQAMLKDLDMPALQAAWKKWVVEMKDPWPSQRQKPKK